MKALVATSVYEAARPYLDAFLDGVRGAARGHEVELLAVNDGLREPDTALGADMKVRVIAGPVRPSDTGMGRHISAVRAAMLSAAEASDAAAVVFCDADDVLLPEAIGTHLAVLETADISVGDLQPVDAEGRPVGGPMFGAALPQVITAETLAETNVCGFSNTAVRRAALAGVAGKALPPVVATDWWVFAALLDAGCTARRVEGTVALYRQHGGNLLGAGTAISLEDARRRLAILADHHRARGDGARAEAAERLAIDHTRLAEIIALPGPALPGPWHADAARWCRLSTEIH